MSQTSSRRRLTALALLLAAAPAAARAQAGDYVLDSRLSSDQYVIPLPSGMWTVGATDGAWNPWNPLSDPPIGCDASGGNCARGWTTRFTYILDAGPAQSFPQPGDYWMTPALALANAAAPITLDLPAPATLRLRIDDSAYGDNAGTLTVTVGGTVSAVPEPATLALLGTGLLGLAASARRRGAR